MRRPVYLLVTTFFPLPDDWRCSFGYDYAAAIQRTGKYDVIVVRPDGARDYDYHGISVYGFKSRTLSRYGIFDFVRFRRNQREFLNALKRIGLALDAIAVCEAYNEDAGFYGWAVRRFNPKVITALHHHSLGSFGIMNGPHAAFWPIKFVNFLWMRYVHEHQDLHIFISSLCERSFRRFPDTSWSQYQPYIDIGKGIRWLRPAKIRDSYVLHNGVDCRIFSKGERTHLTKFRMGCIANFNDVKDHMTLMQALALISDQLGDWEIVLVGSGPTRDDVVNYVKAHALADHVQFREEVQHEQLARFYRGIDLFVLPSYFEGFGCVYAESWACGTPFIACVHSGIADLFDKAEACEWLIKPQDHRDLARKILRFYRVRDQQNIIGDIDIDVLVPRFLEYLERMG